MVVIFINLLGSVHFYLKSGSTLFYPVAIGLCGYLLGIGLPSLKIHERKKLKISNTNQTVELITIKIAVVLFALFAYSLFIQRGIPLFESFDNATRSSFGKYTYGRIRSLCTWLPMTSLYSYYYYLKTGKGRKTFLISLMITLVGLAFYSYKVYLIWLVVMLFYVYYYNSFDKNFNFIKWFLYSVILCLGVIGLFSIWLSENFGHATVRFVNRLFFDQMDGFNYLYQNYIPIVGLQHGKFLVSEIQKVFNPFVITHNSFMNTLATYFYGKEVTWGIVPTLFGYFYIDYGNIEVFICFLLFGYFVNMLESSLKKKYDDNHVGFVVRIALIYYLGLCLQNGTVFNITRGLFVSIVFYYFFVKIVYVIISQFIEEKNIHKENIKIKKIAFVVGDLGLGGGGERVVTTLANWMVTQKYSVFIFHFGKDIVFPVNKDVSIVSCDSKITNKYIRKISRIQIFKDKLLENKITHIIAFGWIPAMYAASVKNKLGIKLIISERNNPIIEPPNRILRYIRDKSYDKADYLVFQTHFAKKYFGYENSCIIYNPLRENLPPVFEGIPKKKIVNFCRFTEQKNIPLLIHSFVKIQKEFPSYQLCLYGEGNLKDSILKEIKDKNIKNIEIFDANKNVLDFIVDAKMFVSTSNYEGLSNSLLEAMAIGLPVISTDCPMYGAREFIKDSRIGYIVPMNDEEKLIDAIRNVIKSNNITYLEITAKNIRNKLSANSIGTEWLQIVNSL